jgi:hypothetical protein
MRTGAHSMGDTVNAVRQAQDIALAWAEVQKTMWERWMRGLESQMRPSYAEGWERASGEIIDAWENTVKLALKAQLDWTALWTRQLGDNNGAPKEVTDWSNQTYELMKAWHDAQVEMWNVWFENLRSFGPVEYTNAFVDVSKSWYDAMRKSLDASTEWTQTWPAQAAAEPPARGGNGATEPQPASTSAG